ncbi:hypothetical protein PENSOL_c027G10886 [Penicillium solitum]|uniref:F-box domain-containing protein n=1 Tax=Penicillium solitum TaxID=60172 RepID=A0A1V6QYG4_9EURO|nr:uncharacterized protein PENSOL_c027G10886 [Penicillium solitum]OQD94223.1 hypothetical protein PENSOL_c027G10886 [Penicillium solitum]
MISHIEECPGYKTAVQQQPGITAKSAINKALNTPEILEMILAEMDMRTLLTCTQRVCRAWLNLINALPSIQKALFFTPIKESEWGMGKKMPNPLLAEFFPSFFPEEGRLKYAHFIFSDIPMTDDVPPTMPLFVRAGASWRKMLVQRPPMFDIGTLHIHRGFGDDRVKSSSIPADEKMQTSGYDGLRMEKYFDLLLFSSEVKFLTYTHARLYWSTERPISLHKSYENVID